MSLQRQSYIFDHVFTVCLWFDEVLGKGLASAVRSVTVSLAVVQFLELYNFVSAENIAPSFLSLIYLGLLLLKYQVASRCLMPPTRSVPVRPTCTENSSTEQSADVPATSG